MLRVCSCAEGAKLFAILFENNIVLRTNQQSLVKWAWVFSQPMATPAISHPGALGPVLTLERFGFGPRSAN